MVKGDLDSQTTNGFLLTMESDRIRARNHKEEERKTIKRVVYSVIVGSALISGGIFL